MKTDNPKNNVRQNDTPNPGEYIGDVVGDGELREQVRGIIAKTDPYIKFCWTHNYLWPEGVNLVDEIMQLIAANRNTLLDGLEGDGLDAIGELEESIRVHNIPECQHFKNPLEILELIEQQRTKWRAAIQKWRGDV